MNAHHSMNRHPRGTVMVLVVAVLGLLAVIGTVYVLSARTERNTSASMSEAINLNLARDAVVAQVQQVIGSAMLDGNTTARQIGGFGFSGTNYAARDYDYPEVGTAGHTVLNANLKDEPWLVKKLHVPAAGTSPLDFSQLQTNLFDPSTGTYAIPLPTSYPPASSPYMFSVVFDQTNSAGLPKQDSTSDDPPSINTPDTAYDSYIYLLPFSDASGIRYRYGVRILDTSRMANLNTGSVDDTASAADVYGRTLTSVRLAPASGWPTPSAYFASGKDTPALLQQSQPAATSGLGRAGLSTTNSIFQTSSWQQQMLTIEKPTDNKIALFDISDELELRSYGEFGTPYHIRPAISQAGATGNYQLWPYTLSASPANPTSASPVGNPARRNYTTYSFSRDLRPYPDPAAIMPFTLTSSFVPAYFQNLSAPLSGKDFGYGPTGTAPVAVASGTAAHVWPTAAYPFTNPFTAGALPRLTVDPFTPLTPASSGFKGPFLSTPSSPWVPANNVAVDNQNAAFYLAMTATNLATAMEQIALFSHREACQFAANYATSIWSGVSQDAGISGVAAYYLPAGPSFVDRNGICIRTAINAAGGPTQLFQDFGGNTSDLNSQRDANGNAYTDADGASQDGGIYLGYAAQPFIYAIAAESDSDGSGASNGVAAVTLKDAAVVLYNPYAVALSLKGYHLTEMSTSPFPFDIDLTGQYVPAGGYLIITNGGGANLPNYLPAASATVKILTTPMVFSKNGSPDNSQTTHFTGIALRRPFWDRSSHAPQLAVVDRAGYPPVSTSGGPSLFASPTTAVTGAVFLETRGDVENALSMGLPTSVTAQFAVAAAVNYKLYDRPTDALVATAFPGIDTTVTPIVNISDFNKIMRVGHHVYAANVNTAKEVAVVGEPVRYEGATHSTEFTPNEGPTAVAYPGNAPYALLTERINDLDNGAQTPPDQATFTAPPDRDPHSRAAATPESFANRKEALIYFDFCADPTYYTNTAYYPVANLSAATVPPVDSTATRYFDPRALALLDCIAMTDRYFDLSIDVGGGNPDLSKLRLPGKINVNTASGEALRAIPNMTDQMVANILSYRDRPNAPLSPTYNTTTGKDYSNKTTYPGSGIHSLAELMIPIDDAIGVAQPNIFARDSIWATMYNSCTVRSDTFVLYGYLEAVRQNPAYAGTFNNSTDWYLAGTTNVSDSPRPGTGPALIRVARRRWVAILDRSYSNTTAGSAPRIVAIKDLPY